MAGMSVKRERNQSRSAVWADYQTAGAIPGIELPGGALEKASGQWVGALLQLAPKNEGGGVGVVTSNSQASENAVV